MSSSHQQDHDDPLYGDEEDNNNKVVESVSTKNVVEMTEKKPIENTNNNNKPSAAAASSSSKLDSTAAVVARASSPTTATSPPDPKKSKTAAQKAFELRDAEASRAEHEKQEPHGDASGDMVKATVFGGLDGIMTIFAVVTAAAGGSGGGSWQIVLIFGLSSLVADAWAMGFGEFLGGMAELDQAIHEREREIWEFETNFEEEKEELKLIYMKKGYPEEDAEGIVNILAKNKDHFIDAMMKDELEISVDIDDFWGPVKSGAVMFCSFCCFGMIPLLPYFAGTGGTGVDKVFITSCCLVGVALVLLGCVKGYLTNRPMAQMAIAMLFSGAVSGVASYIVSNILALMVE